MASETESRESDLTQGAAPPAVAATNPLAAIAAAIATAVLVWFGNSLTPWWPLMWLAPLPILWFALRAPAWAAGLVAFVGWLAGSVNVLPFFLSQQVPFLEWLADFGGLSLSVAIGALIFRALVLRGAVWSGVIALPALWVTLDWARYWWTPHGTSADLAYTQLEFLPFLQLSSITGPWGMSFLLVLFPAAMAAALHLRKSHPRRALRVAGTVCGILLLVLAYGTLRLNESEPRQSLKVGLVAHDTDIVIRPGPDAQRLWSAYAAEASRLAAAGAQVVVLPEKIAVVPDSTTQDTNALFQSVANSSGATLVVGELHDSPGAAGLTRYNRAMVYRPHSTVSLYDKEHLLPPWESDETPGTVKLTLARGDTRLGVAICKDMDFTSTALSYAELGTQLMLVPAWDFNGDRTWHGHMAIMRGVEGGFSIARAAKGGYLTVSDDRGRIVAEARSDAAPFATLLTDVPIGHESTLFQRWGNWFAWVATAMLILVLARATSSDWRAPLHCGPAPARTFGAKTRTPRRALLP